MTTLARLRRLVRARTGVPTVDDFFSDDVIDDAINSAIDVIEAEQRWPWQEHLDTVTVTVDDPDIPLDDTWRATRAVYFVAEEVKLVSPTDLLGWVGAPTASAPQVWTVMADRVAIAPAPAGDIELTHYWYSQPATLYRDDDEPAIPAEFSGSIVSKAAEILAVREGDNTKAATHLSDYAQWLTRMRRDLRRSTGPLSVRVRPGGWI